LLALAFPFLQLATVSIGWLSAAVKRVSICDFDSTLQRPPSKAAFFMPSLPPLPDMRAYFAEENPIKRDGIAVRQLRALRDHQGPREKKLRLSDVKEMFAQMKGVVG
jgi:hypothetical protein